MPSAGLTSTRVCFRTQEVELGAKRDVSNMEDLSVEQMAARANQVTDEVHTRSLL